MRNVGLTEGCVDWQGFGRQLAQEANALLGGTDAVLIFDESGFAKKGEASAGVVRQWNGRLEKVDNCQVGVFATLCRGDMATLIDARLYLPEDWCNVSVQRYRSLSSCNLTSSTGRANGSSSSIRLLGQVGSFSKVSLSHAAGSIPLSFAVPSSVWMAAAR